MSIRFFYLLDIPNGYLSYQTQTLVISYPMKWPCNIYHKHSNVYEFHWSLSENTLSGHSFCQYLLLLMPWTSNSHRPMIFLHSYCHFSFMRKQFMIPKCKYEAIFFKIYIFKGSKRNLEVSWERTWKWERRPQEMAWSKNFHLEGLFWVKHSWDTKTWPNSTLGNTRPADSTHSTTSVTHISGGSLLSWHDFRASTTLWLNKVG